MVVVAGSIFAFLKFYGAYIDGILYSERLSQMREVTSQLLSGLEDVVDNQWLTVKAQSNYLQDTRPKNEQQLIAFLKYQNQMNGFNDTGTDLVVVDSQGGYYTQNGIQGMLQEMDYLLTDAQRVSFVSKSMTGNVTRMYFLSRLSQPYEMRVGERKVNVLYCGIARNMDELNPYFECSAYDGSNSVYVVDPNGLKLFSGKGTQHLLDGYNTFSVLGQMQYLHGSSFEKAKQQLQTEGLAYSNAVLKNQEYYYALYQMQNAQWILIFLVPSSSVAVNTVRLINTTVHLIMLLAVCMVAVCYCIIFFILRLKQKQAIRVERQNSEALAQVNLQLEDAVRAAENASKAKSNFLANMSHDIRSPMNAIVGITNLMAHENGLSDKMHGYIHKVQLSSRHLLSLINDVLDMSKIESSEVTLNQEPFCLADQVNQTDNIIRPQAVNRRQHFTIQTDELVHEYLIGDSMRLRQI